MSKYDDALKLARNYYPDNKFLDTIFPELKPTFRIGDYVSFKGKVYQISRIYTDKYIIVTRLSSKTIRYESVDILQQDSELILLPDYEEVISTWGDGHNPTLVAKINHAWYKNREGFKSILQALYTRDIDEITDSDAFQYPDWLASTEYRHGRETGDWTDYNKMALRDMQREWDYYATNYLSHIAHNCDLECILAFLYYPALPIYKD